MACTGWGCPTTGQPVPPRRRRATAAAPPRCVAAAAPPRRRRRRGVAAATAHHIRFDAPPAPSFSPPPSFSAPKKAAPTFDIPREVSEKPVRAELLVPQETRDVNACAKIKAKCAFLTDFFCARRDACVAMDRW